MLRRLLASVIVGLLLAGTASLALAASTHWSNLKSVTVTLRNGSLPPPFGAAHTTRFASRRRVAEVTKALNANHIAKGSNPNPGGCAGGTDVTIKIVPKHGAAVTLKGYHCGSQTYGHIAGNVPRFLKAIGLKL